MRAVWFAICVVTSIVFCLNPTAHGMENVLIVHVAVSPERSEAGRVPEASVFQGHAANVTVAWHQALDSRTGVRVSGDFALESTSWDVWNPEVGHRRVRATNKGMTSATVSLEKLFEGSRSDSQIRVGLRLPGPFGKSRRSLWNLPTSHGVPIIQASWVVSKTRDPVLTYVGLTQSFSLPQDVDGATYVVGHNTQVTAGVVHTVTRNVSVGGYIDVNAKSRDRLDGSPLPGTEKFGIWATPTVTYAPTLRMQVEAGLSVPLHAPDEMSLHVTYRWTP